LEEAENCEFTPGPQPEENPEDGQALATTPPCLPPVLRPVLQARDVAGAVRSVLFPSNTHHLVPTLLSQFTTSLTPSELFEQLEWMWVLRRELATFMGDSMLRGHMLRQPPEQILNELLWLLEMLAADLH